MAEITHSEFLREYTDALLQNCAAAFIGAGFSVGAGFVDWRDLLRDVAHDLGLDIDDEHDLIAIAQYEVNRKGGRDSLDRKIIRRFDQQGELTDNHRLLARLPLDTLWTTNYDRLIERSFEKANKRLDVKFEVEHLKHRSQYSDATLFKMHGDVSKPGSAVLTKDDYEKFELVRGAFTDQLRIDLLTRQFVFLGFSFTDPNIEYTFNRLRRLIDPAQTSPREHYCILRRPLLGVTASEGGASEREIKRFEHRVNDLARFGVQVVPVNSYDEIPELLRSLNRRVNTRNVLISGAAHDFSPLGRPRLESLCRALGKELIKRGFSLVSGFGLGISGAIIIGAHEEVALSKTSRMGQRLRLYPFPWEMENGPAKQEFYDTNRNEMVSQSGATVFIAGNKLDVSTGQIVNSPGVQEEFRRAVEANHICVPVGATGHAAMAIWEEMIGNLSRYFPELDVAEEFRILGNHEAPNEELVKSVLDILDRARQQGASE